MYTDVRAHNPAVRQPRPWSAIRVHVVDVSLLLAFILGAALYAGSAHAALDRRFSISPIGNDVWFEGDIAPVTDTILHRWTDHSRNVNHPLFPLLSTLPAYALRAVGLDQVQRLLALVVIVAAAWGAAVFVLLRLITPTRADAVLFALLAHASAAAIFWLPMTETWALGSTTLLLPLCLLAWEVRRPVPNAWYVAGSVLSLSVTTSNWVSGIAAAVSARRLRDAIQITANALAVTVVLWAVQKALVPPVPFFIGSEGSRFVGLAAPGAVLRALLVHSVVMPRPELALEPKWGLFLSAQHSAIGSSGWTGLVATVAWLALLAAGLYALAAAKVSPRIRAAIAMTIAGQFLVYLAYGEETFLYALQVAPLLIACAAMATATRIGPWVRGFAAGLVVLLLLNNVPLFSEATKFFAQVDRLAPFGR
jgi:hypothetical protein